MPKSFIKNIFMEIRHSLGRFLSILCIVAIGVAFFAGIKASAPDMKYSADHYFDDYHVQDIQVFSTLGLHDEDIEKIKEIKNVEDVQPTFSLDTLCQRESSELVVKVLTYQKDQPLNKVRLVDGRMPKNENECVVQATSATAKLYGGFKIGEEIHLYSGKDDKVTDSIQYDTYTIVGTCFNPNYLSYELGSSDIGSGSVNSFIYIQDSNVLVDYYTEVDVSVKGCRELNTYSDEYFDLVDPVREEIENLADGQIKARIQENQDTINDSKKKLRKEIRDGQKEIDDAKQKIVDGQIEIQKNEQKLVDAKSQLDKGWKEYNDNIKLLDNLPLLDDAISKIEQGEKKLPELENNKAQVEQGIAQLEQLEENLLQLDTYIEQRNQLDYLIQNNMASPEMIVQREILNQTIQYLSTFSLEDTQAQLEELRNNLVLIDNGINEIQKGVAQKETLLTQRQQLMDSQPLLKQAYNTLVSSQQEYYDGLSKIQEAKNELVDAQRKVDDAQKELNDSKKKYEKEIQEAQDKLDELEGEWFVLDRNSHYSYRDYGACADRMDGIARVFPVFFFLVAALVCMTTMTRMVDEQRNEIGTLKALGYSKKLIAFKYLIYALIASILGSILGCGVGMYLFPKVIYGAWNMLYNLEDIHFAFQPGLIILASCSVTAVTLLATFYSIYSELREVPSQLMRPKAAKTGKKIFLENISFIWNRLSFLHKVTARNIFRYRKRFYMTIVGIAGCSALLVAGFGINDSISDIVHQQYDAIYHYNASVSLKNTNIEEIEEMDGVDKVFYEEQFPVTAMMDGKEMGVSVHIIDDTELLKEFTTLQDVHSNKELEIDDQSIIISQKMASKMDVKVGNKIEVKDSNDQMISCTVTGIYENYVGHHIFMTRKMYDSWNTDTKITKIVLLKTNNQEDVFEKDLGNRLMNLKNVKSVTFYSKLEENFEGIISSISMVVVLLVVSAAALAFVVLYNLSNVNISERIREIATIKVLGFLPNEVSAYVNRESTILTMIGAVVGLTIGIGLHHLIMNLAEMDDIMFGRTIKPISFVISFILTVVFSLIINLFMKQKLKKVQMVESLKAVE